MNKRELSVTIITSGVFFLLAIASQIRTPTAYSYTERRALAKRPEITASSLVSGEYMTKYESFVTDQFPERDRLRALKAAFAGKVLRLKDNNGYFVSDGYLSKLEFRWNREKWDRSLAVLKKICDEEIAGTDCSLYFSLVPDKNRYLAPENGYPVLDYAAMADAAAGALPEAEVIDITDGLSLASYYRTDQHWRQECLPDTAGALARAMGADADADYVKNTLEVPFYGAYAGQAAVRMPPDRICWLTNYMLEGVTVTSYDTGYPVSSSLYDMEKAHGRDPYEMFLSGADALLTIENPYVSDGRELILFRDSFGSSIAPLLIPAYEKITLVDLRYISGSRLSDFIDFTDQDVLFLYSALILNSGVIS